MGVSNNQGHLWRTQIVGLLLGFHVGVIFWALLEPFVGSMGLARHIDHSSFQLVGSRGRAQGGAVVRACGIRNCHARPRSAAWSSDEARGIS